MKKHILIFIILLLSYTTSFALSTQLTLDNNTSSYTEFQMAYFTEKPGKSMGIDKISKLPFSKTTSNNFTFGYKKNNYWFHFSVVNNSDKVKNMVLEVTEIIHKTVDLYVVSDDSIIHKKNGLSVLVGEREIKESTPSFSLHFNPKEKKDIYIHLNSIYGVFGAIELKTDRQYKEDIQTKKYIYLVYFTAVGIIALYNLILFFYLREKIYLLYIGHTMIFLLWAANYKGVLLPYINIDIYNLLQTTIPVFFTLLIFFSQSILETKKYFPFLHKILNAFILICVVSLVWMLISMHDGFHFMNIIAAPLLPFLLFVAVISLYNHHHSAKLYLFALSIYLTGMSLLSLLALGVLPYSILLSNAAIIGSFFEAIFFSLLLAYRINMVRQEYFQTQKELIKQQKTESSRLFHSVAEKTKALNYANKKLEAELIKKKTLEKHLQHLANTDSMTGLLNRRSFFDSCDKAMIKASNSDKHLACIIIDIDYFKRINDTYGHDMGDTVIIKIAELILENTRTVDSVGRIGGEEFAILMPNIDKDSAFQIADRVRTNISKHKIILNTKPVHITVSIGISCLNHKDKNIHSLLKRADTALYKAKENGRNQVVIH